MRITIEPDRDGETAPRRVYERVVSVVIAAQREHGPPAYSLVDLHSLDDLDALLGRLDVCRDAVLRAHRESRHRGTTDVQAVHPGGPLQPLGGAA
jgi:hypothetical protein